MVCSAIPAALTIGSLAHQGQAALEGNGLQPNSDDLQPNSDGLQQYMENVVVGLRRIQGLGLRLVGLQ